MRVLLVEDDDRVAGALVPALTRRGLEMQRLPSGAGVLDRVHDVDVVLLDLGLPDIDGVVLCRRIRAVSDVAVIVVSARGEVDDRVQGLRAGADDYLVKPYDVEELLARVEAVRRRRGERADGPAPKIEVGDVTIDLARHEVLVAGEPIALSRKEFQVLALVAGARGSVCSREHVLTEVWGHRGAAESRSLDVHVATLRTKLGRPALIETVRGVGYRLGGGRG
ncbi:response regulator transcription factor [Amycolatopsis rhabdoformis]|uniref:Sensory transduction protein RegX3 n=1 Tax=Amycolatopsis rhabdoformis TaxID=1448059 RepID=A0ABZ1I9V2_9PSEU|nr:response regulator transcription factor [Amycolatopsis rhabdoformis]WSE30723.1 response regulator transcription factor [Amycolatopsis rhabdoformis]